jgi:O-antigen/teichoic acid export membrane protein
MTRPLAPGKGSAPSYVARIWHKLRTAPAEDHGAKRWRRIFVSMGGALFARLFGFACNILMIPLALGFLGAENYGIWVTLTGAVTLLTFFDLGIGIGLQNRVAMLLGKDQLELSGHCLRSTLAVLISIVAILFCALVYVILETGIPSLLFRDPHFAQIDFRGVLLIVVGAFMLGLPLGLFSRMAFGLQQGWISSVATSFGAGFSLLAVFLASTLGLGFKSFVAVTVLPPIIAQLICLVLLRRHIPGGLSLLGSFSLGEGLETLRQGSHYMLPQIAGAIITQGPLVFLGTLSSPLNAATYSILARIGAPFQQLQQMFLVQVWPAITEAMHRQDTVWLRTTLRRVLKLNIIFGTCAAALVTLTVVLLFPLLTKNSSIQPTMLVILIYAASVGINCVNQGLAYIANGLSRLTMQNWLAIISIAFAFTVFPFVAARYGITGTLGAFIVLNGLFATPLLYREYWSYMRQEHGI